MGCVCLCVRGGAFAVLLLALGWLSMPAPSPPWALTKENAVFVWSGIVAIIVANIWLRVGVVGPALLLATVLGPFAGVLGLVWFAGGVSSLVSAYHLFFTKSLELQYAY